MVALMLQHPNSNSTLNHGAPHSNPATATDSDGTFTKVEFFNGSILLSTLTTVPYTISGSTASIPMGVYLNTAKAYANRGAVSIVAPVMIAFSLKLSLFFV